AVNEAKEFITEKYGKEYLTTKKAKKGKGAQDAHEAVRPASVTLTPDKRKKSMSSDQYKVYKLIYNRFLPSQMAAAVMNTMTDHLENNNVQCRATGSKVKFPGFMKVYVEGTDEKKEKEKYLPELEEGMLVKAKDIKPNQHFTQPPPRYTEARLVDTMEKKGIGRPSTYAPTLDTIQRRGYVTMESRRFHPTEIGEIVIDMLQEYFPEIIDVDFTVKMESDLDAVEEGKSEWIKIIDEFYKDFSKRLEK